MKQRMRKPNRLPEYDYSQNGAYFVTICTVEKRPIFWANTAVGAAISRLQMDDEALSLPLSAYGRIAECGIRNIPYCYPSVRVEKYCIMPNHVHMILRFSDDGRRLIAAPTLSVVVGQMKRWVSKQSGVGVWQKGFYDRVIRNETEYNEIWNYIHHNPLKYILKEETL